MVIKCIQFSFVYTKPGKNTVKWLNMFFLHEWLLQTLRDSHFYHWTCFFTRFATNWLYKISQEVKR